MPGALNPQTLSTRPNSSMAGFGSSGRTDKIGEEPFVTRRLGGTSTGVTTNVRSGFGAQLLSHQGNSQSPTMGMKAEADMSKCAHPGPGTYEISVPSIGKQMQSDNPTSPDFKIGTGPRFGQYTEVFKASYNTPGALNPRPTSGWLGDNPAYSIHGRAKRSDILKGLPGHSPTCVSTPGAGAYETKTSAMFDQTVSTKETSNRIRIGTAKREVTRPVTKTQYVSRGHETELYGAYSPAPNNYRPNTSYSSRETKPRSCGFGSGDRFSEVKSNNARHLKVLSPGPGEYTV